MSDTDPARRHSPETVWITIHVMLLAAFASAGAYAGILAVLVVAGYYWNMPEKLRTGAVGLFEIQRNVVITALVMYGYFSALGGITPVKIAFGYIDRIAQKNHWGENEDYLR